MEQIDLVVIGITQLGGRIAVLLASVSQLQSSGPTAQHVLDSNEQVISKLLPSFENELNV